MRDPLHPKLKDETNIQFINHNIMETLVYIYITPIKCPKIPPKCMANYVTNRISGYLRCVKLGILLCTNHGQKPKVYISVPKTSQKIPKIEINQLIVVMITVLAKVMTKTRIFMSKINTTTFPKYFSTL